MNGAGGAAATTPAAQGGERRDAVLAALYAFLVMAAYSILKPLREEMGVQCGARNLKWLWLGTLGATLAVLPVYWRLVASLPRRRFVPLVHRGVAATLIAFFAWFVSRDEGAGGPRIGGVLLLPAALYVWISVFNLLVLSIFWSLMADAFDAAQGKRLFGRVATGITCGALAGPWFTSEFADDLDVYGLLLVSAGLLEAATWLAARVSRRAPDAAPRPRAAAPWRERLAALAPVARSPYLGGIAGYLFVSILASTVLYAQRTELFEPANSGLDKEARTAFFGWNDFATQSLTLVLQALVAGALLRRFGTGVTLAVQMTLGIAGFALLGSTLADGDSHAALDASSPLWGWLRMPGAPPNRAFLAVLLLGVALKGSEYGLSKPARETLFTVVSRTEKYQAKSLIDTGLYRFFDQVTIWGYAGLHEARFLALPLATCAWIVAPLLGAGVALGFALGAAQSRRAERAAQEAAARAAGGP